MTRSSTVRALLLVLFASGPIHAQQPQLFDSHVHLHEGEKSIADYTAENAADKVKLDGFAIMWFGGGHQALQGNPASIRTNNDAVIAWAKKDPKLVPIATVHPYDGDAALAELQRVAGLGIKVLKIHPHTQKFDAA